jgi:hypothetical protein
MRGADAGGVAHDEARSNSSRGHRVLVEASIEADGRQGARNTGRMTFNDTPSGSASPRAIDVASFVRAAGALRAGDRRSQRRGEPDRPASRQDGVSGGELRAGGAAADRRLCGVRAAAADAGLQSIRRSRRTAAARARDSRCARSITGAARSCRAMRRPRSLGALAHRWTYAVFAAALLRDVGSEPSTDAAGRMFEGWVPADRPEMAGRTSSADRGTARRADRAARMRPVPLPNWWSAPRPGRARRSRCRCLDAQTEPRSPARRRRASETLRQSPEGSGPEFLDGVDARVPSDLGASWSGCGRGLPTEPCR